MIKTSRRKFLAFIGAAPAAAKLAMFSAPSEPISGMAIIIKQRNEARLVELCREIQREYVRKNLFSPYRDDLA